MLEVLEELGYWGSIDYTGCGKNQCREGKAGDGLQAEED